MHNAASKRLGSNQAHDNSMAFQCPLCEFRQPFVERDMFLHLRGHLKQKQIVPSAFKHSLFTSNVHSTFNSHKCREHSNSSEYAPELVQQINCDILQNFDNEDNEDSVVSDDEEPSDEVVYDTEILADQLECHLAAFF